jgi:hypothetical protein
MNSGERQDCHEAQVFSDPGNSWILSRVFKCYGWLEGDASEPGGKDAEGRRVSVAVGTFGMSGLGSRKGRGGR